MFARNGTIVLFPFMAQGHMIPFLSLALKLERERDYAVVFVNTPQNIKKLKKYLPESSNIRFLELPFDSTQYGLPQHAETLESLSLPQFVPFMESSVSLRPGFRNLISVLTEEEKQPPLCIISDMFFAWSAHVAHEFGTSHAIFNAGGGYGMAAFHTSWLNLPHLESDSDEFQFPGFPAGCMFKKKNMPEHMTERWGFVMDTFQDWKETDAMLFNTVEDMDSVGLNYFREQFPNCTVHAIGSVVSSVGSRVRAGEEAEAIRNQCMKWLDSKPESSVLFVAFGSQSSPSETQTFELAKALEASNVNFLWAVQRPTSFATDPSENIDGSKEKDWFPIGFEERITGRGLLLKNWVPQLEILSHKSTGAFLSHCGWNSVIEALSNGVPILGWPLTAEQPFNAQFIEKELGICIAVAHGMMSEVKHEEIAAKIELMMMEEEGKKMRRKACKVMKIMKNATTDWDNESPAKALKKIMEILRNLTTDEEGRKGSSIKAVLDEIMWIIKNATTAEEGSKGSSVKAFDSFLNTIMQKKENSDLDQLANEFWETSDFGKTKLSL